MSIVSFADNGKNVVQHNAMNAYRIQLYDKQQ